MERVEVSVALAEAPTTSTESASPVSWTESTPQGQSTESKQLKPPADKVAENAETPAVPPAEPLAEPQSTAPEESVDLQVAADAPALAVNIEQEVSLSAPPDLNSPECPSCWKALRATDKFCCWCGEAQPNRVLPFLKLCLECSTFLPEKANYCYSCGTDVGYSSRRKVRVPHELFKDEESEFFPRFDA